MNFSVLTYNTLLNAAYLKLDVILDQFKPDILCLQEVNTDSTNLKLIESKGYVLADYSNSFIKFAKIYGVATFYNPSKFRFIKSSSLKISSNISEFFFTLVQTIVGVNKPKSVLRCDFVHKSTKKKIIVCNSHLLVVGSNALRVNHIKKALKSLDISDKIPLIIGGDFNYLPYQRRRLERIMKKYNLVEATSNIRQTVDFSIIGEKEHMTKFQRSFIKFLDRLFLHKMKNDYVFYRGVRLLKNQRINIQFSDHYPLLSTFKI